jgi:hypothetical protein
MVFAHLGNEGGLELKITEVFAIILARGKSRYEANPGIGIRIVLRVDALVGGVGASADGFHERNRYGEQL